jgi:hypothetical protein
MLSGINWNLYERDLRLIHFVKRQPWCEETSDEHTFQVISNARTANSETLKSATEEPDARSKARERGAEIRVRLARVYVLLYRRLQFM